MQMDGQSLSGVPRPQRQDEGNRKVHPTARPHARMPAENEALLRRDDPNLAET